MKHKYRNHYFPVLICIVFCLCIFLVRYAFSARTQTNASLPVTEFRQSFSFLNTIDSELSELCDGDLNNTSFFQELENRTNIHIDWITSLSNLQIKNRFEQNSDSVPDLIGAGNFSSIYGNISADDAINRGDICDLTELIPKYAPNYYKIIQQKDIKDIAYTDSGRIAAVCSIKQSSQKPWCGLQIRKDWLDELGLDVPVTYDDWETVLTAFKEKKGATAPLWIAYNGYAQDESLNSGFGISYGFFQVDGKVFYGPAEQGWKDYLTLMNHWYQKGLLDVDYMTGNSVYADGKMIASGTSGAWFGMYTMSSDLSAKDPDIEVVAVSPPKLNENDTLHIQKKYSISDNMFYISSECEHPEIVLKWIDYLFSDEGSRFASYGTEGKTYTLDKDQNPVFTDLILHNSDGLTFYQALKNYTLPPGLPSAYIDWKRELQCVPPSSAVMCDVWASTDTSYMLPVGINFTSEERTRLSKIMADINSCMQEYTTNFITGIKSLDQYEEYLNALKKSNIDEAVQIYQNAYDRYLAKHSS